GARHAQIGDTGQFVQGFDAFGDDDGAGNDGDVADRTQNLLAQKIVLDAGSEHLVGLDELRSQIQPAPQVRKSRAQVVDGELHALGSQPGDDWQQIGPESSLVLLGDLDHQAI